MTYDYLLLAPLALPSHYNRLTHNSAGLMVKPFMAPDPQPQTPQLSSPLGLVAGNGRFPIEFAEKARALGLSLVVVALKSEADSQIESMAQACEWISIGQLGKLIKILKRHGVKQMAFLGGVKRIDFVGGFRIDWVGLRMLSRIRSFNDDSLLRGIIREIESAGITVIAPHVLLHESVPQRGRITPRALTASEIADAQIGWEAARAIGSLDIGQSVIVRNKTVIAVEAVEGTAETIRRAGTVRGPSGVLVKLAKSHQDLRVDLPAVGLQTLEQMQASNLSMLVIEAGKCLMLDPQAFLERAMQLGIAIVAAERVEDLSNDTALVSQS